MFLFFVSFFAFFRSVEIKERMQHEFSSWIGGADRLLQVPWLGMPPIHLLLICLWPLRWLKDAKCTESTEWTRSCSVLSGKCLQLSTKFRQRAHKAIENLWCWRSSVRLPRSVIPCAEPKARQHNLQHSTSAVLLNKLFSGVHTLWPFNQFLTVCCHYSNVWCSNLPTGRGSAKTCNTVQSHRLSWHSV